ncbi:MAG TPA: hypothetical protein VN858_01135 [Casimicrobiaceae bacterium]|nr:hypothetical protein [Casimicrobiaceae bacterium]
MAGWHLLRGTVANIASVLALVTRSRREIESGLAGVNAISHWAWVVSALACAVDYTVTPKRLRPGYELRLSKPSMAVAFGAGLAPGSVLLGIRRL